MGIGHRSGWHSPQYYVMRKGGNRRLLLSAEHCIFHFLPVPCTISSGHWQTVSGGKMWRASVLPSHKRALEEDREKIYSSPAEKRIRMAEGDDKTKASYTSKSFFNKADSRTHKRRPNFSHYSSRPPLGLLILAIQTVVGFDTVWNKPRFLAGSSLSLHPLFVTYQYRMVSPVSNLVHVCRNRLASSQSLHLCRSVRNRCQIFVLST